MAINRPSVAVYIGILLFFISCRQSLMATNNEGMKMIHFVYAREEENERERESDLRHVTSLVWAPHRREKRVGARVHLDHQGNRHRPGLGFFFCFVFLQIFPFTHTQHIKVFPSRRTKNYFENKKKKTLKLKFFFHPSIFEDLNSFVLVEGKSQRTSFPNPFNVNR